jgi:hypothetical protein
MQIIVNVKIDENIRKSAKIIIENALKKYFFNKKIED